MKAKSKKAKLSGAHVLEKILKSTLNKYLSRQYNRNFCVIVFDIWECSYVETSDPRLQPHP